MNPLLRTLAGILERAAVFGLLLSFAVAGRLPASAAQSEVPSLARIDLRLPADLELVQGLAVFAQLYTPSGGQYLLAPLTPTQSAALSRLGLGVRILDGGRRSADYYLVTAFQRERLEEALVTLEPIQLEDRLALVRAMPSQIQRLSALGLEVRRLELHPLPALRPANPRWPVDIVPKPQIQAMIDQATATVVAGYNGGLSGEWTVTVGGNPYQIATRFSRTQVPIANATQYAYERFNALGLNTIYHEYFLPPTGTRRNVIAEQPGLNAPERIFLITAHLDSTSQDPYNLAPGADDNASGSTAVLVAADILSQYTFNCTLRYALFTGEEQGLIGSAAYAAQAAAAQENIEGVLNLDMIGYNSDSAPIMELHTRPSNPDDDAIANLVADVIAAYHLNLTPQIIADNEQRSDHASFWDYGYPGILAIEDYEDFTPYYHTTGDQLETLNLDYFTQMVKAAVGAFAHLGCLQEESGALLGVVSDPDSGIPLPGALITATHIDQGAWSAVSAPDGSYLLDIPGGAYQVEANLPGYLPYQNPAVQVTSFQTTTLDIAMPQCNPIQGQDFTYAPAQPQAGEPVTFTGAATTNGSAPLTFAWNFGDGGSASGPTVQHTYTISDVYTATMSATNCAGTVQATHPVTVTGFAHIQVVETSLDAATNPLGAASRLLHLTNAGGDLLEWQLAIDPPVGWLETNITAGTLLPQKTQAVQVSFNAPDALGVFTADLEISSNDAQNALVTIPVTLTVTEACLELAGVDFSHSPANPLVGQVVTFTASLEQGSQPVTFAWDFGDGTPAASGEGLEMIVHSFPQTARGQAYSTTLNARNLCSVSPPVTKAVWVSAWTAYLPQLGRQP